MPDYRGKSLVNKDLTGVSDLTGSDFRLVNLSGAKLDGKDLGGSKFDGCRAEGTSFKGCTFGTATSLDGGDFQASDWTNAVFTNVSFTNWGSYRGPYMRFAKVDGVTGIGSSVNLNGMLFWPVLPSTIVTPVSANITPTMSADNVPSPYVASGVPDEPNPAWGAFDQSSLSAWLGTGPPASLVIDLGIAKTVTQYKITCGGANSSYVAYHPKNWTFGGSNDGSTWTTLDTQSGASAWTYSPPEVRPFSITNTTAYRYYRLQITVNQGGATYCGIGDLTLMGY